MNRYDIIVIGCGPAGMTAAIYAKRAGKNVLILEKEGIGGQMAKAPLIENYPGFPSVLGSKLADNMFTQVMDLAVEIELEEVKQIKDGKIKTVITEENEYQSRCIIIATGAKYRMLGLPGEENLIGKGVHFCAACDGAFYKGKEVAVIGGANSAVATALSLSNICKKVYLIHRSKKLTADYIEIEKLTKKQNIEILLETSVTKLIGEEALEAILIKKENEEKKISLDAVFISIGFVPQNEICKDLLEQNQQGFIITKDTQTSIPGIFVAGDCREKKVKQLTIATSDGTLAATYALSYLEEE